MRLSRRELLLTTAGAALGAAGTWWSGRRGAPSNAPSSGRTIAAAGYGHGPVPPADLGPLSLDPVTIPPPSAASARPLTRPVSLEVTDERFAVSADQTIGAWTFGGSVPGPILRATEGDRLEITLSNRTGRAHNLHFHGRHEIEADGWEPVPPGSRATYRLTAGPAGLHPYHCDFTPVDDHIANGLYGLLIVDPPIGRRRPPAQEVALVLGGFDVDGDGQSDLFGWNGRAGFFAKYPIKVRVGQTVRVYLANLVTDRPAGSFHLHAETFKVYRNGTNLVPDAETDIISLGPAERAVLEFRLPARGRYMFHPHQKQMAERGAMGWFSAV